MKRETKGNRSFCFVSVVNMKRNIHIILVFTVILSVTPVHILIPPTLYAADVSLLESSLVGREYRDFHVIATISRYTRLLAKKVQGIARWPTWPRSIPLKCAI